MEEQKMISHLFRQQYGKMVSILTRIFGLRHLEMIEDAVQDTFVNAVKTWQGNPPENPEAWLVKSAKNRVLDLLRKIGAEDKRIQTIGNGIETTAINELFLEHEVDDSVLRMIFAACHPKLGPKEQLAFSLKIVSGFSHLEISNALLLKEETVKKRLTRARKVIQNDQVKFEVPTGDDLKSRLARVLEVVYLIFNEGFHSSRRNVLIREELCGEAMRLTKILLGNSYTATANSYALFALFCFQSARLKSKVNDDNELVSLDKQDRSLWYSPLILLGDENMEKAVEEGSFGCYHFEAAIAAEHVKAVSYIQTNWVTILKWYQQLNELEPSDMHLLNIAVVHMNLKAFGKANDVLHQIVPDKLGYNQYLYYGTLAEYFYAVGERIEAIVNIELAIDLVDNQMALNHLKEKKLAYQAKH